MCEQTTFIYNGHCYTSCPDRTYMMPEKPRKNSKSDHITSTLRKRAVVQMIPQKQCAACHQSCYQCRGPMAYECTECTNESFYREVTSNESYCDVGPTIQNDELEVLKLEHASNETSIHRFSQKFSLIFNQFSIFIIFIFIVLVTIFLIIVRFVCIRLTTKASSVNSSGIDKKNYAYNRIAYDGNNEHIIMEQEIVAETSEDDSSDDAETIK